MHSRLQYPDSGKLVLVSPSIEYLKPRELLPSIAGPIKRMKSPREEGFDVLNKMMKMEN
jgi:hypothetical protein